MQTALQQQRETYRAARRRMGISVAQPVVQRPALALVPRSPAPAAEAVPEPAAEPFPQQSQPLKPIREQERRSDYEAHLYAPLGHAIRDAICMKYGVKLRMLLSRSRKIVPMLARHEVMWELRQRTNWSYKRIARFMNRQDHTAVIYGIAAHQRRLDARTA
ncbi:helix-turn-helix domain-containing protein [Alsobacter sp. KACC 23698]|uniref:Helix-turn-helix domain-containing protein n=1 Tax=Alsobacter sp. KACC 23698 TaxID=3149229 RepID=A0AAU7J962_9HYPH